MSTGSSRLGLGTGSRNDCTMQLTRQSIRSTLGLVRESLSVQERLRATGENNPSPSRYAPGGAMAAIELPIDRIATEEDWMREGACRGLTHLFFPPAAERPQARERREAGAREVCMGCSVRIDCMGFAREHHEYGFWGGESEDERHAAGFRLIAPIGVRARAAS